MCDGLFEWNLCFCCVYVFPRHFHDDRDFNFFLVVCFVSCIFFYVLWMSNKINNLIWRLRFENVARDFLFSRIFFPSFFGVEETLQWNLNKIKWKMYDRNNKKKELYNKQRLHKQHLWMLSYCNSPINFNTVARKKNIY